MEYGDIKVFPTDFNVWLKSALDSGPAGQEVRALWSAELQSLDTIVQALGHPLDIAWGIQLAEFGPVNEASYVGLKVNVKIMDVSPPAEVTYVFRFDDKNKVVGFVKYKGEISSDIAITVH